MSTKVNTPIEKAIILATKAHANQFDKAGAPYILHPLRVMQSCQTLTQKITAILHGIVEDTSITLDQLCSQGFNEQVSKSQIFSPEDKTILICNLLKD